MHSLTFFLCVLCDSVNSSSLLDGAPPLSVGRDCCSSPASWPSRPSAAPLDELPRRPASTTHVAVLPITVAALATTPWIARHLHVPRRLDRVILPGLCRGDLERWSPALRPSRRARPEGPARPARVLRHGRPRRAGYGALRHRDPRRDQPRPAPAAATRSCRRRALPRRRRRRDRPRLRSRRGVGRRRRRGARRCATRGCASPSTASTRPRSRRRVAAGAELVLSVNGTNVDARAARLGLSRWSPCPTRRPTWTGWTRTVDALAELRRAVPHRPDPGADRLRLRGVAGPLPRGAPRATPTPR